MYVKWAAKRLISPTAQSAGCNLALNGVPADGNRDIHELDWFAMVISIKQSELSNSHKNDKC